MFLQDRGEPDFVNERGNEFRCELSLTRYAQSKLGKEWVVWLVSGKDIATTYLLCEGQREEHSDPSYEGIACHIDILKIARTE
jgi:hypothetical protein